MKTLRPVLLALLLAGSVLGASIALAQSGGGYNLSRYTMDGGGSTLSNGGDYTLGGTIGQPDAGTVSGGNYTLDGGFWTGNAGEYKIYLPLVLRNH